MGEVREITHPTDQSRVEVFYSLQSDYCYFLLDRLIALHRRGVYVSILPVLGGVLRVPERFVGRDALEQAYFEADTKRTAEFLGLPHVYPDPSPVAFEPGSLWVAVPEQPRLERLFRLFVGALRMGGGFRFLDSVGRRLWDGTLQGWDQGDVLADALAKAELNHDWLLAATTWESAKAELDANAAAMLEAGHWGVPLMVYRCEPFYGQDRFDQLVWRIEND